MICGDLRFWRQGKGQESLESSDSLNGHQRSKMVKIYQHNSTYIESCTKEVEALPAPVREAKAWPSFRPKMSSRRQWPSFGANFTVQAAGNTAGCSTLGIWSSLDWNLSQNHAELSKRMFLRVCWSSAISFPIHFPFHPTNWTGPSLGIASKQCVSQSILCGHRFLQDLFKWYSKSRGFSHVFTFFHQAEKITGHRWAARTLRWCSSPYAPRVMPWPWMWNCGTSPLDAPVDSTGLPVCRSPDAAAMNSMGLVMDSSWTHPTKHG